MADKGKKLAQGFALPTPAARTPVKDQTAAKFVKAERKPSRASRLRRDIGGERLAIYLPPAVAEDLRVRCARERRSISDAVTEAVTMWLKR
jgi:Ribbon-helix-helix protein, copG family